MLSFSSPYHVRRKTTRERASSSRSYRPSHCIFVATANKDRRFSKALLIKDEQSGDLPRQDTASCPWRDCRESPISDAGPPTPSLAIPLQQVNKRNCIIHEHFLFGIQCVPSVFSRSVSNYVTSIRHSIKVSLSVCKGHLSVEF